MTVAALTLVSALAILWNHVLVLGCDLVGVGEGATVTTAPTFGSVIAPFLFTVADAAATTAVSLRLTLL